MHRLRTCAAKLRPLTASQTVKNVSHSGAAVSRTFQQWRFYTAPVAAEPFLSGTSSNYVEEMYFAWLENPQSVHKVSTSGGDLCSTALASSVRVFLLQGKCWTIHCSLGAMDNFITLLLCKTWINGALP